MDILLNGLRAAGERTRLRLLAILARNELTVSELTQILGQSQPRVSRHLRLLCEARLLDRIREGTWVFYRLADRGAGARLARALVELIPGEDLEIERDLRQLETVRAARAEAAARYFRENAAKWDRTRSLYIAESEVEQAMLGVLGDDAVEDLLDLGTGTGRILQVFAAKTKRALGIDLSREMLAVARANLEGANLQHCQVRHGDIHNLSVPTGSMDVVTIHHVLHFLDDPGAVVAEAARTLRPGGRLLIADFAPHTLEFLRTDYSHRRLGFADKEVITWCQAAGLVNTDVRHLRVAGKRDKEQLTVSLWISTQHQNAPTHRSLEVA